jgi:hypothetical protein
MCPGEMGHFVGPSNARTTNSIRMAKNGMSSDPMLRWCIPFAWAWKKTSRIKQKNNKKGNFQMVSNLSKLQKNVFSKTL